MAKFANPRKSFNWSIQISPDGINSFMFQKVKIPDATIDKTAHGDTNHDIKTAGRVSYEDISCEKLSPSNEADNYLWNWFDTCQSSMIGGGAIPSLYKKQILITEFAEDNATALNQWVATGAWPCSLQGAQLDRQSSDNLIQNVDFSIDKLERL